MISIKTLIVSPYPEQAEHRTALKSLASHEGWVVHFKAHCVETGEDYIVRFQDITAQPEQAA